MEKPRTCPHCLHVLRLDAGFSFDREGNLICDTCNKIVFPINSAAESDIDPKKKKGVVTGYYQGHMNHNSGHVHSYGGRCSAPDSYTAPFNVDDMC